METTNALISDTLLPNLTALIVAITALATAIGAIIVMLNGLRKVNSQLVDEDGRPKLDVLNSGLRKVSLQLVDEDGKPKIDAVKDTVATLATNIDGAMNELKETIAAKNLAIGHAEGLTEGRQVSTTERQERTAEKERVEDRADLKAADKS